ncbi:MAG: ATP-binding protein [Pseudomonadota bacterium]|nr:ATP-binding protein [Pseudomonadota bacterium]
MVFLFLFLLVIILGTESLRSLSYVNAASAQIRIRWLPSTRALGDLNNLTTDFPAAEVTLLRADNAAEQALALRQIADLDRGVAAAQRAYEQIRHDGAEDDLYRRFHAQWSTYRSIAAEGRDISPGTAAPAVNGAREQALKAAYDAASSTLGLLTDGNVASAREASERSDLVYAQARRRIAFAIALAGLLVAGAMVHVTRSISAPLVELAERMHRLAASETTIDVRGTRRHDEIGEMARAVLVFRDNAIDLAQNRHALAQQAAMLQEKLAAEQRLTLLQRNFVSMASHEFRTPLAIIDGHAQRLISIRDRLTAAELTERAHKVRNTVRRMTQLIDNLIGSARLIDGRIELNCRPTQIDLGSLVREACNLQRELTPEARILELVAPQSLMVFGDPSLLSQVFGNLLSNAVKYSPDAGLIQVSVARDGAHIDVLIADQGIGIPDTEQEHVFERYYRGSNTSGIVGSGVGLYLVKTIVELHEGTLTLESREGDGSRFRVRLPALTGMRMPGADFEGKTSMRGSTFS